MQDQELTEEQKKKIIHEVFRQNARKGGLAPHKLPQGFAAMDKAAADELRRRSQEKRRINFARQKAGLPKLPKTAPRQANATKLG